MTHLLLEWVATASLLILAVIALRALLGRHISARLRYALWAAALVRLLVPLQFFSLPVPAVLPEIGREPIVASVAPTATAPVYQGESVGAPAIAAPLPSGVVVNYDTAATPSDVTLEVMNPWEVLGWLWLAGSLIMAAGILISNLVFAMRLRRVRVPLEDVDCPLPVYLAENLPSPCLFGLMRPTVYVTADAARDPAMLRHILTHEHTHFRHADHIWNILRSAALAIHWWNPLVWLAMVLSGRDCELACDEGALKRLGDSERIAYGRTLLALITVKPRPGDLLRCSTTMTGGQKSVFDRVTRIARAPKRWLWAAVAAVIAASLACVCAFGQAAEADAEEPPDLIADLTFTLDESDPDKPVVRMDGTVEDVELTRGAFWEPKRGLMGKYPYGSLSMVYPPFTSGIEGHVLAGWLDAGHTKVSLSTEMTAMLSSYAPSGWWEFVVDLEQGEVLSMESSSFGGGMADTKVRIYPASISDEEAVKAARIAAKLLTAAEDYYNSSHTADFPYLYTALLGGAPFYSVGAGKALTFDTIAEDLDPYGAGYEITRYASVDLDGDGTQELILYVEQQGAGFYFILHDAGGELYGYDCIIKSMGNIKTDGTFFDLYLYSQEWDRQSTGYSKVTFTNTGLEFHPFIYAVSLPGDLDEAVKYRYVVDGQSADSQTFEATVAAQDAKPDITWHEFQLPAASVDLYAALPELYAKVLRGESRFVLYKNEPPISIDEIPAIIDPYDAYMCLQRYAVVDLLGGLGSNKTPQVLVYFGGVAGDSAGYLLLWDEDDEVHGEVFGHNGWRNRWFMNLKTDGTFECTDALGGHWWSSISCLRPTAAGSWTLHSQAVRRGLDDSSNEIDLESFMSIEQELTEREFEQALEVQRAKPDVTWHGGFPLKGYDSGPVPTQTIAPTDLANLDGLTFSDGWHNSVNVEGVDVQEMYWHSPSTYSPYGRLFFTNPTFLGSAFEGRSISGNAQWGDNSQTYIQINWSWDGLPYLDFDIDLDTGSVSREVAWDGLTEEGLLTAARTLAWLMEQAEAYKTSDAYRPVEDGPLPFVRPMELEFASGAGAWQTNLLLYPDGSFVGDYSDADMTIEYVCQFHGRFGDIRQVTDASWSLTLEELVLDTKYPVGTEWDEGLIHYISSNPYGFDAKNGGPLKPGAQFMFYTPEAKGYHPTDELYGMQDSDDYDSIMYQFWGWWPAKHGWGPHGDTLGCYALCNIETGQGFFDLNAWGIA